MRISHYVLPILAIISSLGIVKYTYGGNGIADPQQTAGTTPTISTLAPAADAYTRNGAYATINYGTTTTMVVRTVAQNDVGRNAYLKFSISSSITQVSKATLRIYGRCTEAGALAKTGVYGINTDSWTETGITWNNAPTAITSLLSTVDVSDQNTYWDLDVTSFVQAELAGDRTVSFLVKSPTNINKYLEFNSKENTKNRPQLVLTVPPPNQAPVLNPIGNLTATVGTAINFTASASDPDDGQSQSYSLIDAPAGANIGSSTGAFSWTPTATGTFTFTVRVSDNGSPVLYDDEQITVTVNNAPNEAPVLNAIGNKTAIAGKPLTFTANAADANTGQVLTYSLINAPKGATIDAATGVFNWTPTSSGDFTFTVQVTDNGSPALSDEEQLTITITDPLPNQAPVLDPIGNLNATVGKPLTFTATASDADNDQTINFSLGNAPDGATINSATGAFNWTPNGSGTFTFTVKVSDNGSPILSDEEQITVTVDEATVNQPPVLDPIGNLNAVVGKALTFKAHVTDADAGQTQSFSLVDAPDDAYINESTGAFSWTPSATGTFTFTVLVTDNGSPVLYDEEQITVTVNPSNLAPILTAIGNKVGTVGKVLNFTASATDPDGGQILKYSLLDAPNGASIGSSTGAFSWTPTATGNFTFTVRVTDNGSPVLYDDEQITITVNSPAIIYTVTPVADAYTRNGTYASTNYGTTPSFVIKTTTTSGTGRASYLKFPLSNIGDIKSAVLRIYGRCTESGITTSLAAYGITDDSWTETGINWNNAPAGLPTSLNTISVNDQALYYEIDVTSFVQAELAGDKTVSFLLKQPSNLNHYLEFNSRENTKNKPQLVLSTSPYTTNQPPVLDAIGNKNAILGQPLTFTASATDPDAGQSLTYALLNAPVGASLDANTGAFSWIPTTTGTFTFTVRAMDNGSPVLSDDEQITVTVAAAVTTSTFSNTQSTAIPNPGIVSVPITVTGLTDHIDTIAYGLQAVNVKITHPADGELTLQLQSPDGKIILLAKKSPGVNFVTTFDGVSKQFIDNNEIITSYSGNFSGGYRPRQELSLLNNGQNPNGTWNLIVKDDTSASTAGVVAEVNLVFGSNPAKPLLSSSTLPIIKIYTDNGVSIPNEPKVLADMYIINNGGGTYNYANQSTYQYKGRIGIEIRGNSSALLPELPKRQYGFEARAADGVSSVDVSFFGMPKQSDWILSSVMPDKSLLRNVLTYQIARGMGWWASRTQFCEVMINDEYRGVFIFEEKIKKDKNRVDIEKMSTTDITAPNVTGGYIFKLDDIDAGAVTWQTKISPKFRSFQFVYPKAEDVQPEQKKYLQSYVDSFEAALNGPDFQDPVIGFRKFAYDTSFMDFFIIAELSRNMDAYHFSTYYYKKRGGKIVAMPVWDFDRAWRNSVSCNTFSPAGYNYIEVNGCGSRTIPWWWPRLMQDAKFKHDLICRYNALRQTTLSLPNLYKIIDSSAAVLNAGGQQRNFTRWNILSKYVQSSVRPYPASYNVEIDTLKSWIAQRLAWLDNDLGACINNAVTKNTAQTNIVRENEEQGAGNVYPSPFNNHLSVRLNTNREQKATIQLISISGETVYKKTVFLAKGTQVLPLDFGTLQLAKGLYLLQVNGTDMKFVRKVLKE